MNPPLASPDSPAGVHLAEEACPGRGVFKPDSYDILRDMPGAAAGGAPEDLGPRYPPILHLHLQQGPAELLGEGVHRLDAAGIEGAADLVDLDVDPVTVGDLLQLWDRPRPPDPPGTITASAPPFPALVAISGVMSGWRE